MNFCKFYNKIMNYLESICVKANDFEEINNTVFERLPNRTNVKKINIIFGITYIILSSIGTIVIYLLLSIIKIIYKIYNFTSSICDTEN